MWLRIDFHNRTAYVARESLKPYLRPRACRIKRSFYQHFSQAGQLYFFFKLISGRQIRHGTKEESFNYKEEAFNHEEEFFNQKEEFFKEEFCNYEESFDYAARSAYSDYG